MRRIRPRSVYDVLALISFFLVIGGGTALASYVVSSNSQIGPGTISGHKPPTGKHANIIRGSIAGSDVASGGIGNPQLAIGAVHTGELAGQAVSTPKIANGAVSHAQIGHIPQVRVEFTAAQAIHDLTDTPLSFDVARYDNDSFFGLNHTRLTVPVDGVYAITADVTWDASTNGDRFVGICKNDNSGACPDGTTVLASDSERPNAGTPSESISTQASLSAGDFVDVGVIQNTGGDLDVQAGSSTNLTMTWVGNG